MVHRNERYESDRMTRLIYQHFNKTIQGEFTLENFAGAFCVLAAGLVIACFVAVMEIWTFIRKGNTYPPLTHNEPGDQKNIVKADMFIQVDFNTLAACVTYFVEHGSKTIRK